MILIPLRLGSGLNDRGHWRVKASKVKAEREAVGWALRAVRVRPQPPLVVTLTRIAPSNGLDDDNLRGALKAVRDEVASWLGVDDKRADLVLYSYRQKRGPWGVEIEWMAD